MRVAIIGAGPAGLTAAYQILKSHQGAVDIFEGADCVGGLSRSVGMWDYTLDLGPHRFFTKDKEVWNLWREMGDSKYVTVSRQTRILYRDQLFDYPLKPLATLKRLGPVESLRCVASYFSSQFATRQKNECFEDWAQRRFGRRLFWIFFKAYSEKLWGLPCAELDAEFGKQRIQKFSLPQAIISSLGMGAHHRTLVDEFPYAEHGTGDFWDRTAKKVKRLGGSLFLNSKVEEVKRTSGGLSLSASGRAYGVYDHLISTMPLTHLIKSLPHVPEEIHNHCSKLTFRNTILAYLLLDRSHLFQDQWLYINSSSLKCGRITNFNNWSPKIIGQRGTTAICVEYWAQSNDPLWNLSEQEFLNIARFEISSIPLFSKAKSIDGFRVKIPNSYPIYRRDYKSHLNPIIRFLGAEWPEVMPIGRYGSFKYNNQDHSMKMGMLAAEKIISGKSIDLWSVNNNSEYQEGGLVEESDGH